MKHFTQFTETKPVERTMFYQDNPPSKCDPYIAIEGLEGFYQGKAFPPNWSETAKSAAAELWARMQVAQTRKIAGFVVRSEHGRAVLNGRVLSHEEVDQLVVALLRASKVQS